MRDVSNPFTISLVEALLKVQIGWLKTEAAMVVAAGSLTGIAWLFLP